MLTVLVTSVTGLLEKGSRTQELPAKASQKVCQATAALEFTLVDTVNPELLESGMGGRGGDERSCERDRETHFVCWKAESIRRVLVKRLVWGNKSEPARPRSLYVLRAVQK